MLFRSGSREGMGENDWKAAMVVARRQELKLRFAARRRRIYCKSHVTWTQTAQACVPVPIFRALTGRSLPLFDISRGSFVARASNNHVMSIISARTNRKAGL
jgi:hypothetical protein